MNGEWLQRRKTLELKVLQELSKSFVAISHFLKFLKQSKENTVYTSVCRCRHVSAYIVHIFHFPILIFFSSFSFQFPSNSREKWNEGVWPIPLSLNSSFASCSVSLKGGWLLFTAIWKAVWFVKLASMSRGNQNQDFGVQLCPGWFCNFCSMCPSVAPQFNLPDSNY